MDNRILAFAILHHAGASICTVEDIDRWHKNNGWECIGYHFFIRKTGEIFRGRKQNTIGAHTYGNNYNSIGICFEGNFEIEEMTQEQINAGIWICNYIRKEYPNIEFKKHKDFNNTSCPGKNFRFNEIVSGEITENPADSNIAKSGKIAEIQSTLNNRYGFNIAVDNIYGNETKTALTKALQVELNKQFNAGLEVDGIFENLTRNACVVVEIGDEGNITYLIQAMLICKGYNLDADEIFGKITDAKIREYQKANGLVVDGKVGRNTFVSFLYDFIYKLKIFIPLFL